MERSQGDPLDRTDLTANEKLVLEVTGKCIHGADEQMIDRCVAPDYIQHTHGIGQGRAGLTRFLREIAWKRPHGDVWRPIKVFASGNFVILYKLLWAVVIIDIFRIDSAGQLAEHWDVVQPLPAPDYDPMKPSEEDFARFSESNDRDVLYLRKLQLGMIFSRSQLFNMFAPSLGRMLLLILGSKAQVAPVEPVSCRTRRLG